MATQTVRVFLGNLPPEVTVEDVQKKANKYAHITSVELKQKDTGTFAFVDICDTETKVERFFRKLSSKSWRGCQLRVQKAKESFLDRLAKERREDEVLRKNCNTLESSVNFPKHVAPKIERSKNIHKSKKNSEEQTEDEEVKPNSMSSDSDTPVKDGLRMFRGTGTIFGDFTEKESSKRVSRISSSLLKSKLEEERKILQKLERSHSVWRDSNDNDGPSPKCSKKDFDVNVALKKMQLEDHCPNKKHNMRSSFAGNTERHTSSINGSKCVQSEMRRLKAIDERQKELLKRKEAVKLALSSIDTKNNKKIVFDPSDDEVDLRENINVFINNNDNKSNEEGKLILFNEDEMDGNTVNIDDDDDFRIRNQFEGRKGQKLLKLQSKYGNDKRFTLDERFIESDEESLNQDNTKSDEEKMLEIVDGSNGIDIKRSDTSKRKSMLRYDPTNPEHTKFEVKNNVEKRIKKIKREKNNEQKKGIEQKKDIEPPKNIELSGENESPEVSQNKTVVENQLPVVSRERFSHVTDTLRESLQNKGQPFSLLEMFGDEVEEKKDDYVSFDAIPIPIKPKGYMKHFVDESSEEEGERETQKIGSSSVKVDAPHNFGIQQESLFFKANDPRFREGSLFFHKMNTQFIEEFGERRKEMKNIVTLKIKKQKKREALWSTKLGRARRKFKKRIGA